MTDDSRGNTPYLAWSDVRRIDAIRDEFERELKAGGNPSIEGFLKRVDRAQRTRLLRELVELEVEHRHGHGIESCPEDYLTRFSEFTNDLEYFFRSVGQSRASGCPDDPAEFPEFIGPYRIRGVLGVGAFKMVYRAHDRQLDIDVALAVPHRHLLSDPEVRSRFLEEARILAHLDHPSIVPVRHFDETEEGVCYFVEKLVQGENLRTILERRSLGQSEAVELVATMAEALHYVHANRLVHRDVKPGNILIGTDGSPLLTDFGLALRDEDFGKRPEIVGTVAYMSPEQARQEGHLVDGRTDIYSLGVVLYELLTGAPPFRGDSASQILERIVSLDPRPPRQIKDSIPRELERICLKALSKRLSDRYNTASDMAEDLRHFLHDSRSDVEPAPSPASAPRIVPRGLRAFEAEDAEFFLDLLPGPRDRSGLPESIRFWKIRVEETEPDRVFRVGVMYGPSGCGKSSLVKAGLLPRLADHINTVFVEATASETEARLRAHLLRRIEGLRADLALTEMLRDLRSGRALPSGGKVFVVIDQFEQWLHGRETSGCSDLVQALRQCDGEHLQCLLMVRDDFWMAVSRFMKELDMGLQEGHNSAAVHRFDLRHAEKVLTAFGRAYGALPEAPEELSLDQESFVRRVVLGLSEDRMLISIRLSLFADMVRGRPWSRSTLKEIGGPEGVGVQFLEKTFGRSTAPPEHLVHRAAVREILKRLLPPPGTHIKGHSRSWEELREAAGYQQSPESFTDLMRILDSEVRLLTPVDPEGIESDSSGGARARHYQLTHDDLVPPVRDWLRKGQRATRRGRAEILLADRASLWAAKPERKQLPSFGEWARIRAWVRRKRWGESERRMMRGADRYHVLRGVVTLLLLSLAFWGFRAGLATLESRSVAESLLVAEPRELPDLLSRMESDPKRALSILREWETRDDLDATQRLHVKLALFVLGGEEREYLQESFLRAEPEELKVLQRVLSPSRERFAEGLWRTLEDETSTTEQHLRAACMLAAFASEGARWDRHVGEVAALLASKHEVEVGEWLELLLPVKGRLVRPLEEIFFDESQTNSRKSVGLVLAEYLQGDLQGLLELVRRADPDLLLLLARKLELRHPDRAAETLQAEISREPADGASEEEKDALASAQANAAVVLLAIGETDPVWPLFERREDPRLRSFLIHRVGPAGVDPAVVMNRLKSEPDVSRRRALVLSLGGYPKMGASTRQGRQLLLGLEELWRHPDAGLHAAVEWLLRKWSYGSTVEEWTRAIQSTPGRDRQWRVNSEGQTMVAIKGPVEFLMGSPKGEKGRIHNEKEPTSTTIPSSFAISSREVTVAEFLRFRPDHDYDKEASPSGDCPVNKVMLEDALAYCAWLSGREGLSGEAAYRLPTEAEWEYTCRAHATTPRFYGNSLELLGEYAWYFDNAYRISRPVGTLKPNDFGLFDVLGNIGEWTDREPPSAGKPRKGPWGDLRHLRGASMTSVPSIVRSAQRTTVHRENRNFYVGFRVARSLE